VPTGIYKHKPMSEETKAKLSLLHKGKPREWLRGENNPAKNPEVRKKISQKMKLKSKEISERMIRYGIKPPSNKGLSMSEEQKKKIKKKREAYFDRIGRKEKRTYKHSRNSEYFLWRRCVLERDEYACQACGVKTKYLQVHHILSWAKFPHKRYDISNGLTLCEKCHRETKNYGNKKSEN